MTALCADTSYVRTIQGLYKGFSNVSQFGLPIRGGLGHGIGWVEKDTAANFQSTARLSKKLMKIGLLTGLCLVERRVGLSNVLFELVGAFETVLSGRWRYLVVVM